MNQAALPDDGSGRRKGAKQMDVYAIVTEKIINLLENGGRATLSARSRIALKACATGAQIGIIRDSGSFESGFPPNADFGRLLGRPR
jgi:hypothetical protein